MSTEYKLSFTASEINEKLRKVDQLSTEKEVVVQNNQPTSGSLWIDTDSDDEINLAEIDDNTVSTEKTWSSAKIKTLSREIVNKADTSYVDNAIVEVKANQSQLQPLFAESEEWLNENGETDKVYILDGNVWHYGDENQLPSATYTNLFDKNADGFVNQSRLGSTDGVAKAEGSVSDMVVTNYAFFTDDWEVGDTIYFKGLRFDISSTDGHAPIGWCYTSKAEPGANTIYMNSLALNNPSILSYDEATGITTYKPAHGTLNNGVYIRFSAVLEDGYTADDIIITFNEEIIGEPSNGDSNLIPNFTNLADPTSSDWVTDKRLSTGGDVKDGVGCTITNYVSCKYGDIVRIKGLKLGLSLPTDTSPQIDYFDTSGARLGYVFAVGGDFVDVDVTNDICEYEVHKDTIAKIRICGTTPTDVNNVIITVNEEITYTESGAVSKWTNTGIPFVEGNYDEAISNLNYDVNQLKGFASNHENRLKKLETEGISSDSILEYVVREADEVLDRVLEAQSTRTFNMAVVTDLHNNGGLSDEQILHASQGIGYIADRFKIDTFVSLGDHTDNFASSSWADGQADMEAINSHHHKHIKNVDEFRLIGNHDFKESRSPKIHKLISAFSKNVVWGDMLGCYFYKDYEEYKLRVICLNTSDEQYMGISTAQYNWFIQSLDLSSKSNASEWQTLILSHVPLDWYDFTTPAYILQAYLNGTSWTNGTISCDFANKNQAKIIATIHGHIHNFLVDKLHVGGATSSTQIDIYRIAMPEVTELYHNHYDAPFKHDTSYPKVSGTAEDTSFNVLCIDLDNHVIKAICYGAGVDREINY